MSRLFFLTATDGVLNNRRSKSHFGHYVGCDDDKLERLKQIVDATDAKIVVSSTWRLDVSRGNGTFWASGIYQYLIENLQKWHLEVFDITPECGSSRGERGREIHTWLQDHEDLGVTNWVVLDDEYFSDFNNPEFDIDKHLVKTSFYALNGGLQEEHVNKAIEILNEDEN